MKHVFCSIMQDIALPKWFYEEGIGENRAILVENNQMLELRIERNFGAFSGPKYGAIMRAKLHKKHQDGGFIQLEDGNEAIIKKWPVGYTEGQSLNVEIIRERLLERTREKPPITIASERDIQNAPTLWDRIQASHIEVEKCAAHKGDIFTQYGWYEILEQAEQGIYPFTNGQLIIEQCTAMTIIDVDGDEDNVILAKAAAAACAKVIRLFDLQSIVGIDFPSIEARKERLQIAEIFDESMMIPCERTGVNGFGFMQIVMKSISPSLLELLRRDRAANIALLALRRAELEAFQSMASQMSIAAHPIVLHLLSDYGWLNILTDRTGRNWQLVEKEFDDITHFEIF